MRRVSSAICSCFIWLGAVCLVGWSPPGFALGLGPLKLSSALGEPLAARITLISVSPTERESLRVRLGDAAAYERFGLKYAAVLEAIDVDVDPDASAAGDVVLELTSLQPIHAPLLELLVIVETNRGRMLRQYTAFLSPADSGLGGVGDGRAMTTDARSHGPVMPGDTLWGVATQYQYAGVSVDQMMVAIYRDNPKAFGDDISQLQVGRTLSIPAPSRVRAVEAVLARTQVAKAQDQWLDRIRRITLANRPTTGAASGGRLRLVVPQSFPPMGAAPDDRAGDADAAPATTDSHFGAGFGRLSPFDRTQPVATPFDAKQALSAIDRAAQTGHAASAADGAGAVTMAFGQLAVVAPTVFPGSEPSLADRAQDAAAAGAQTAPKAGHNEAEPQAPSAPTEAEGGVSMHMILWLVTALFLLLAVGLWLLFRRRPPEVALLAGLAASESESESESESDSEAER